MKKVLGIFVIFLIFFSSAVNAFGAVSITLYPTSFKLSLKPGEVYSGVVTVVNPNKVNITVVPEKEILSGGPEGSIELTGEELNSFGFLSWISFDKKEKTLAPEEKYEMPFKIELPQNAQPGDHYAALLFRAVPAEVNKNTGIGTTGRVGTVILVNVAGETKKTGIIESVKFPKFVSRGPINIKVEIKNTGNTFFNPDGIVKIKGLLQGEEKSWESKLVFPNYSRSYEVKWDQKYLFGLFKVDVVANAPGGEKMPSQSSYFWAFPWQEALAVVILLVIIKIGVKKLKKKFKFVRID
jgi:hypothetical protein